MSDNARPSLIKQLLGAAIGGSLALAIYYGYEFAEPKVTAYLTIPIPQEEKGEMERQTDPGFARVAANDESDDKYKRIASRARRIAQDFGIRRSAMDATEPTIAEGQLEIIWPTQEHPEPVSVTGTEFDVETGDPLTEEAEESEEAEDEEEITFAGETDLWADFSWDDDESDGSEDMEEEVEHSNADQLPDTGVGVGIMVLAALGGTYVVRRRRK